MTKANLHLSRRDFLRGFSITAAGLALTPGYIGELLAQKSLEDLFVGSNREADKIVRQLC